MAIYSGATFDDVQAARQLELRLPATVRIPSRVEHHNIFKPIMGTEGERALLRDLFDPTVGPDTLDLDRYEKMAKPVD